MSSLTSPDEPFVFGAYATHVTEVSGSDGLEVDGVAALAPVPGEPDHDLAAVLVEVSDLPGRR